MSAASILVTCEHGGNRVPQRYRHLFRGWEGILDSHRGHDPGALDMARYLSRTFGCHLEYATVSRLLVELNRSVGHRTLFSDVSRSLGPQARTDVLHRYYYPYRERIEEHIERLVSSGRTVVHISSHSFTPELDGCVRNADVAWLYDPKRWREALLCRTWKGAMKALRPSLRLRRNYPYRGSDDGLTTHLRRRFPPSRYLGIELEVNQKWVFGDRREWAALRRVLAAAFAEAAGLATPLRGAALSMASVPRGVSQIGSKR